MIRDFFKYHSLGNDFIIVDWFKKPDSYLQSILQRSDWSTWVTRICDRHTGVGADGVLIIRENTEIGAPQALVFNADGSPAQTCLNGLRCIAHYLSRHRRFPDNFKIKMGDRFFTNVVIADSPTNREPTVLTMLDKALVGYSKVVACDEESFEGTEVVVGNPHFVIMRTIDLEFLKKYGPLLESHPSFPSKTNVEFLWQDFHKKDLFHMLVYERGSGITLACSSGAAAAFWLLYHRKQIGENQRVGISMLGGTVFGSIVQEVIHLEARAVEVFSGILIDNQDLS